ncbi:MAG: YkgJ family cysteine cluster protein [Myxococcota bacterium]
MTTIPAVRPDLILETDESHPRLPWVVTDPALARRVRLDERTAGLLRSLETPRSLEDLAERAGLDEATAADMAGRLERLNLLDTEVARTLAADSERAQQHQVDGRHRAPLLIRDDARFTCTMCGSCCTSQNVGPVMEDVLEGLEPHLDDLAEETGTVKGLFFEVSAGDRATPDKHVLCHSSDGACVFLDEEGLCRIHRAHGGEAKPRICRLFPYEFMATPRGVAVSVSMECRGYVDAGRGKPLRERSDEIRRLLDLAPQLHRVRPEIRLAGGAPIPWSEYEALEEALHDVVDREGEAPSAALVAMRDEVRKRAGVDGRPDMDVDSLREDLGLFTGALAERLREIREVCSGERQGIVLHADALDQVIDAVERLAPDWPRVVRPPQRPAQRALFRESMHHLLVQKKLTAPLTVTQGLARLTLHWFLARSLAIHRARTARRRHLIAQDLMDALVTITYVFRTRDLEELLDRGFSEAVADLFHERLPVLVAHAPEIPEPDRATHIYKF